MSELLEISGLSYRYPEAKRDSLRDVDVVVEAGELVVLAGRSGSGKSTLLRAACGLVPHFHGGEIGGEVVLGGLDVRDHGPGDLAPLVGYVAQDPEAQVVSTTVASEIALPLELRGEPSSAVARAVEEVALALAIPHLLERAVDTLSGGELQRVAIAAALAPRPELILLDEPTSQLDPVAGDELIWLLRRLNEEWGVAIVLCEHRLERCLAAADRTIVTHEGTIGFDGAPATFLEWALRQDPALTTPAARMFDRADMRPLPAGVRTARRELAARGLSAAGAAPKSAQPEPKRAKRGRGSADPVLAARDLWVELEDEEGPRPVLRGLELALEPGELVALMGRNGAGKSTLLRTAAGALAPVRGRIEAPGGVAMLPQSPADLLVRERIDEELPGEAGRAALELVGLEWAAEADPRDLSGGERQRLALAIVMAGRGAGSGSPPGAVLLDEPTRGMDRSRKDDLADLARALAAAGAAVVIATHDVEFVAAFAERVLLLGDGELIADGTPSEILSGGWYFATEVARVLGEPGVITPDAGAEFLRRKMLERGAAAMPVPEGESR